MAVLQEFKCPCCDGAIEFDAGLQKMKCPYCDAEFEMDALQAKLENMAEEYAKADGLTWNVRFCDEFPESANHPEATKRIRQAAQKLGFAYQEAPHAYRGSDDFGYYPKKACGAMFEVGSGEECPPIHTVHYDFPDDILPVAVDLMWELTRKD